MVVLVFVLVFLIGLLMGEIIATPCGGYIQTVPGSIQTPNYPDSYPPTTECTWIIEAAADHNVQLIFLTFDIVLDSYCTGDKVEFKDGPNENSPWIASYCGNISPPNITTTGRYLYIRFISDDQIQTAGMHLFFDQVPACKISLNDSSGFISSPNYPSNYPSLTKCVWIISPPYESLIQLTVLNLEIEYETNCLYDSLNIYDGKNESSLLLAKYCGSYTNEVLNSTSNFLFIQFTSDTSDELGGFNASYQVFTTNLSQVIDGFQNYKSEEKFQWDTVEVSETTLMELHVFTSAPITGSPYIEYLSTMYDPSIEGSTIVLSASVTSDYKFETIFGSLSSSMFPSISSTSATITDHVEVSDPWVLEQKSIAEQNWFEMSVIQSKYQTDIAVSRDEDGESSHYVTCVPKTHSIMDSYGKMKNEQIQPTTVLDSHLIFSHEISTKSIHRTAVENKTSPEITNILLPIIVTLITSGIVIGVICAIKFQVKKMANLKVAPVDHHL